MNIAKRLTVDEYFIEMARLVARRSTCLRRAVGCVLVNSLNHVIATGYNGVARGMPHCNERTWASVTPIQAVFPGECAATAVYPNACPGASSPSGTNLDKCEAIHAEQNALLQCRDVMEICRCYVTHSPCVHCAKLLLNTGCKEIVYAEPYSQPEAQELWLRSGRIIRQLG